ncbi:MAG: metallophosphoesterase [Spirochaetia bacterium]|jgi:putative phosphoesterase|nr:metallophosphoesterase [Spirochaetia bacterium]
MKIGILSDIHVDINFTDKDVVTPAICRNIKKNSMDMVIIAGDVASDYKLILASLGEIEKQTNIPCLYVPGNHDIWIENYPEKTSWEIYELLKSYPHNLANGSYEINKDWVVIGDLGWYDFSFGDSKYSFNDFSNMKYEERIWQDSIKAVWGETPLDMHKYFINKLEKQLIKYKARNVIIITHVLPIQNFTVQPPSPMWEYMNAFLGSSEYGELILKYPNVKYAITGHVHYRKQIKINNTEFICNCLGYRSEWHENDDAEIEVNKAMMTIDLIDRD